MGCTEEKDLHRPIGEYVTPIDTVVLADATIAEALEKLRTRPVEQKIIYFYAVDSAYHLKGVVSTRQLLLSPSHCKVADIMQWQVAKLKINQTLHDALELFDRHSLLALPIVDMEGKLVGAVDVQMATKEAVDLADLHNRTAIFQMIGLTLEDRRKLPLFKNYILRMPWLLCNVFSGVMCALISRVYERVLVEYIILAFFVPLVLTLSESTSLQSMAQSLQFLRRPRFSWKIVWKKSIREWMAVVLLAFSSAAIMGVISFFWGGGMKPSLIIGIGILFSSVLSAFFGTLLPVILYRMKLDPKVAAGPVVLMLADMLTMGTYLSLATWWLLF